MQLVYLIYPGLDILVVVASCSSDLRVKVSILIGEK